MIRITVVVLSFLLLWTPPTQAENLNKKYGPSWNCSYISPPGDPLEIACKPCQSQGMDFYRDSPTTGHCVPKDEEKALPPVTQTRPPPHPTNKVEYFYIVRACNRTGKPSLNVALGTNDNPRNVHAVLRGWWTLGVNECKDLIKLPFKGYLNQVAFLHAQMGDRYWPAKVWVVDPRLSRQEQATYFNGKPHFCVSMKRFEWQTTEDASFYNQCSADQEKRAFATIWIDRADTPVTVKEVEYR